MPPCNHKSPLYFDGFCQTGVKVMPSPILVSIFIIVYGATYSRLLNNACPPHFFRKTSLHGLFETRLYNQTRHLVQLMLLQPLNLRTLKQRDKTLQIDALHLVRAKTKSCASGEKNEKAVFSRHFQRSVSDRYPSISIKYNILAFSCLCVIQCTCELKSLNPCLLSTTNPH